MYPVINKNGAIHQKELNKYPPSKIEKVLSNVHKYIFN